MIGKRQFAHFGVLDALVTSTNIACIKESLIITLSTP